MQCLSEREKRVLSKFETLQAKLSARKNKFDAVQVDLQNAIRVEKNKADEAIEISTQNRDKIESLNFRLAEQEIKLVDQDSEIRRLLDDIDDLKNQSLRKTLIFKDIVYAVIPYNSNNENYWN